MAQAGSLLWILVGAPLFGVASRVAIPPAAWIGLTVLVHGTRSIASGLSAAVDPWGRVLSVSDFFGASDRTMIAQVPVGRVPTLYPRTGDLFAWLCVAGLAVTLLAAAMMPARDSIQLTRASQPIAAVLLK